MNKSSKEIHVTNNDFLLHSLSKDIYTQNDFVCECSRSDIKQNWIVCLPLLSPAYLVCGKVHVFSHVCLFPVGEGDPVMPSVRHRSHGTPSLPWTCSSLLTWNHTPGPVQICSLGNHRPALLSLPHGKPTPPFPGISHLSPSSRSARGQKFGLDFTIYTSTKRFSLEITQTETLYLLQ